MSDNRKARNKRAILLYITDEVSDTLCFLSVHEKMLIYESISTYILPLIYALVLSWLTALSFLRNGVSYKSVAMLFLVITHFLGYASLPFRISAKVSSYEYMPYEMINTVSTFSFVGILLFYIFSHAFSPSRRINYNEKVLNGNPNIFLFVSLSFSLLGMIAFYATNGISFNADDYSSKIDGNAGSGFIIMMMSSFVPSVIVYCITSKSKYTFIKSIIISLLFGMSYYILIGGSRNVMFSAFLMATLICYSRGKIGIIKLAYISLAGLALIGLMAIYRYSDVSLNGNEGALSVLIRYLTDSVSPVNYQEIAVRHYLDGGDAGGLYYFISQFTGFIPRFIWDSKPIVTMNSSYYFTTNILGLNNGLNMASTLLGSSMVLFGSWFYWLCYIISGMVVRVMDGFLSSRKVGVIQLTLISTLPFSFFMARESLEFYLFILFKNSITITAIYIIYLSVYSILPKR